jgi:heme oxygenase
VIYESQFRVIDLEENYEDFVQILSRMAHEKEEIYQKSCLDAAITITNYYQKKMQMNL